MHTINACMKHAICTHGSFVPRFLRPSKLEYFNEPSRHVMRLHKNLGNPQGILNLSVFIYLFIHIHVHLRQTKRVSACSIPSFGRVRRLNFSLLFFIMKKRQARARVVCIPFMHPWLIMPQRFSSCSFSSCKLLTSLCSMKHLAYRIDFSTRKIGTAHNVS
jgi:hypothetical protein